MSKKHYIKVAGILNKRMEYVRGQQGREHDNEVIERFVGAENEIANIARDLAYYFGQENPAFDRDRFLQASGVVKASVVRR